MTAGRYPNRELCPRGIRDRSPEISESCAIPLPGFSDAKQLDLKPPDAKQPDLKQPNAKQPDAYVTSASNTRTRAHVGLFSAMNA
jgi:hypothetical protein